MLCYVMYVYVHIYYANCIICTAPTSPFCSISLESTGLVYPLIQPPNAGIVFQRGTTHKADLRAVTPIGRKKVHGSALPQVKLLVVL